jgi:hypothetical protein
MVELVRAHTAYDRQVVCNPLQVRHQVTDDLSALTTLLERVRRTQKLGNPLDKSKSLAFQVFIRAVLAVVFL